MKKYLNVFRAKQKIFLLGVGAQKAGTSWLPDFLQGKDKYLIKVSF